MRRLFGTLAGIAVAILITLGVEAVDSRFYPMPANIDPNDADALARIIPDMPLAAKLIVVAGWFLGAYGGAWMALRITDWRWSGVVVALFVLAGGVVNFMMVPHPLWMEACAVLMPVLGGWLAIRVHHKPYPGEALLG